MNPFTLMFGITTSSKISRSENIEKIQNAFLNENGIYSYLITGIRGCGKTVLLKTLEEMFTKESKWIVINLNPQSDLIDELSARLSDKDTLQRELSKWNISIKLGSLTFTREGGNANTKPELVIEKILEKLATLGYKVLISVDEVNATQEFRKFINFYQILIGKKFPIYLLMTVSNENVIGLINNKASAFLTRIPKIVLEPLN